MSLDGFISGPDDDMDWIFKYDYPAEKIKEVTETIGALLVGRRTYNVGKKEPDKPTGEAYSGAWSGPEFILTHNPPANETDPNKFFLTEQIESAVEKALEAANGKSVNVLGASVAKQCMEHDLLDEITVYIAPILLGNGTRLFSQTSLNYVKMDLIEVEKLGQITSLRFKLKNKN